ncbi:hypothetical protein pqer_cds_622 [Pandoravirus quercus]|uniref:F-box domain containing protein n=2 Tax=Pandoravirus TaxID=2060084 RepID=A0A2U7U9D7_9VIRU|nr:hypothetical protein pqer_cds_622 [Pandoravirus quercus]AVK75044.1 hypothetical protein pqer_cds_622 [Pandoravirus quercus]QBZ81222.1 hypothetical protein pclt_cds_629 [Pandoravirus celtis]
MNPFLPNEIATHILSFLPCWDLSPLLGVRLLQPVVDEVARQRRGLCDDSATANAHKAARVGHWQCLCAMRSTLCHNEQTLCAAIASSGSLDLLQRAHERGWAWDTATTFGAALGGRVDCLRYAVENGCPLKGGVWAAVVQACSAPRHECAPCDARFPCATSPCSLPAKCDLFDVLAYLASIGRLGSLSSKCLLEAAANGRVDILDLVHPVVLSFDDGIGGVAARHGHVACLAHLNSVGYAWVGYECGEAMRGNHIKCLQYLHENGCPWHRLDYEIALARKGSPCHEYAMAHGCFPAGTQTDRSLGLLGRVYYLLSALF